MWNEIYKYKNIFAMKGMKRFLQLVLAVAMLPTLSSVAQSESVVALSGNAYVTVASEGKAFIDEGNCAIRKIGRAHV